MSSGKSREEIAVAINNAMSGSKGCAIVFLILSLAFGGPVLWGLYDEGVFDGKKPDPATTPVLGPQEAGRLVEQLDKAGRTQGICYGWVIDSGRYRMIPKVTPSYSGTFRPAPVDTRPPAARPSVPPRARRTPATVPGARTATPRPRTTAPRTRVPAPSPSPTSTVSPEDLRELTDTGVEFGSNLGVGIDPRQAPRQCPRWVVLKADYTYSSTEKEWISGTGDLTLVDNVGLRGTSDYRLMDYVGLWGGELTGENGVGRLADAIGALPLLTVNERLAAPVPQAAAQAPPAGDKISGPGKGRYIYMGIAVVLIAGGLTWIVTAAVRSRRGTS